MNTDDLDNDQLEDDDLENVAGGIHGPGASSGARSRRAPVSIKTMDGSQTVDGGKSLFGGDPGSFAKATPGKSTSSLGWMGGSTRPNRATRPAKRNRNI